MNTAEFATTIRNKYGAYQNVPDSELVARFLQKYPVYSDRVALDVADSARLSLLNKGLTPEGIKANPDQLAPMPGDLSGDLGRGVAEMMGQDDGTGYATAPPKTVDRGLLRETLANLDPREIAPALWDAVKHDFGSGIQVGMDAYAPNESRLNPTPNLPAIAAESYRRGEANESTAGMYGQPLAMAIGLGAPKLLKGGKEIVANADAAHARALGVDGAPLTESLATAMRGKVVSDPAKIAKTAGAAEARAIAQREAITKPRAVIAAASDADAVTLYRGTGKAGKGTHADDARLGPGIYYTDNPQAAKVFADFRGGQVETSQVSLGKVFDAVTPDTTTPEFAALRGRLVKELSTDTWDASAWVDGNMSGSIGKVDAFTDIARELAKRSGETDGAWTGAGRMNQIVREAGYDAIRAVTRDSGDIPSNTEYAILRDVTPKPKAEFASTGDAARAGLRRSLAEEAQLQGNLKSAMEALDAKNTPMNALTGAAKKGAAVGGAIALTGQYGAAAIGAKVTVLADLVRTLPKTYAWKTASAVAKRQFGELMAKGDELGASQIGLGIATGALADDDYGHRTAVRELSTELAALPSPELRRQVLSGKRLYYTDPDGQQIEVPRNVMTALASASNVSEASSPVAAWLDAMGKQGAIKKGGKLVPVR